jgi:hypothetical protein
VIYQLPNPIDVNTPLGDCTAIMVIDYGIDVNSVFVCRMPGGTVKHFLSDDVKIYSNPMYGNGWDLEPFPQKKKQSGRWPKGAKRNMNFKNK